MVRSVHVVPHVWREASGPSYSVPALCQALGELGDQVELHVLKPAGIQRPNGFTIAAHDAWPFPAGLGVSPQMKAALQRAAAQADVLHSHSLWMLPNVYPAVAVGNSSCKLIVSPRGTLSPWALRRSRVRKALFWPIQRVVLDRAACLHATSDAEFEDIRRKGYPGPVAIIPNAVEIPAERSHTPSGRRRRLLFLGRLHPVKGIDTLLHAWQLVQASFPAWEMVIAGPSEGGYVEVLEGLVRKLALDRVVFAGPSYGVEKTEILTSAEVLVLPSHSENFGMVVAEALAQGLPVIASRGTPWSGLEREGCGWWVKAEAGPLSVCLNEVLGMSSDTLAQTGRAGRDWMRREFSWASVGAMMHATYEWIVAGGTMPGWVHV
jgi:glycosyltransferase involved in cell wall biosynthesis